MKKKSIFMVIMALTLLTACSRERITIKYAEPTEAMTIESEQRKYENKSEDISSKLRFMKNPFRELESEQDNTIYKVYFSDKDLAENRKKVWDKICSLPEVERVKRSIYYPANLKIKLENIHPDYYQRAIENGYDENLLKQRGYLDIRLYVYTSPDIEKNTLT